jgi:soluble lytic murein transglycosylase-like protein
LTRDFAEAQKYAKFIKSAADATGLTCSLICAIGSRESNWGLSLRPRGPAGVGDPASRHGRPAPDGGWGRGLMQIDYEAAEFAKDPAQWQDPEKNIAFGSQELAANLVTIHRRFPSLSPEEALEAAVASYNTGLGNVTKSINLHRDVDSTTAGKDYSKDVLSRAAWFDAQGFGDKIAGA